MLRGPKWKSCNPVFQTFAAFVRVAPTTNKGYVMSHVTSTARLWDNMVSGWKSDLHAIFTSCSFLIH